MAELKNCPFCGSKIKHTQARGLLNFFECQQCGAVVSFCGKKYKGSGIYEAEDPMKNWNCRAEPDAMRMEANDET